MHSSEIRQFSKLKKIEYFSLKFQDQSQAKEFFKLPFPSLKILKLVGAVDNESLSDICKNFPNLERMGFDVQGDDDVVTSFSGILNGLPKLNRLSLSHSYSFLLEAAYPNVKVLKMWCKRGSIALSADFIRALPNLEIHVEELFGDIEIFEAFLASKIKKLNVKVPMTTVSNIQHLMELKNELEKKGLKECTIIIIP